MAHRRARGQADRVPRVLIAGWRPQHLSASEADAWFAAQLRPLRTLPGVERVTMTRVSGTDRHPRPFDWVCELQLADGADAAACAEHPVCEDWVRDLRLLGMRPALAVLDGGREVT
jgi:hypothetical protein